jgi:(p)ppGpp synthase/HD superfamily hydrolase
MASGTQLELAIALACEAHRGQTDKAGAPYILHPLRVMLACETDDERMVAVLHDVVEDSDTTLERLRELGFDSSVIDAIDCLSRRDDESYDVFIDRVSGNAIASRVKVHDLEDNMDLSRLPTVGADDLRRVAKYERALSKLQQRK